LLKKDGGKEKEEGKKKLSRLFRILMAMLRGWAG
jgi:hypothetical protein